MAHRQCAGDARVSSRPAVRASAPELDRLTATLVALAEIRTAAERIRDVAVRTPIIDVPFNGKNLALKCENLQPMGAFKIRGAFNFLSQLPPGTRKAGVITYSSGNHGQAVAMA